MTENVSSISRHPLVIVLVSFFSTGILGTFIGQAVTSRDKEIEKRRLQTEIRRSVVQEFSRQVYKRRVRAEMLASSFKRSAQLDEVKDRKKMYDEAYVKWNSNHQANLFLIRNMLASKEYTEIESIVEFTLVTKIFSPLDMCLTKAYDAAIAAASSPVKVVLECDTKALLLQSLNCGYAITDQLYRLAGEETTSDQAVSEIRERCE